VRDFEEQVKTEIQKRLNDPVYLQERLIEVLDENKRLLEDKSRLVETVQEKDKEIKALVPAKEFYDRVAETDDWMEMATAAKLLGYKGYGRNNLIYFLIEKNVFINAREPYQRYVNAGYFKIAEKPFERADGTPDISRKIVVSQKGVDFIRKLIKSEAAA